MLVVRLVPQKNPSRFLSGLQGGFGWENGNKALCEGSAPFERTPVWNGVDLLFWLVRDAVGDAVRDAVEGAASRSPGETLISRV